MKGGDMVRGAPGRFWRGVWFAGEGTEELEVRGVQGAWKIYLWLAVITYAGVIGYTGLRASPSLWVEIAVTLVAFIGLYGYAYSRRIGNARFWKAWLFVLVCWDLVSALVHVKMLSILMVAPFFWFFLPLCVALYNYGFRSPTLWGAKPVGSPAI
jgi:hypothetical protein